MFWQLSCQCSGGGDLNASMMELLRTLKCYTWETKVVLTLAAFAVYNGEFRLMAQLSIKNPSVKYVAILKQLSVKSQLKAIDNIIESIIKVTKCFVEYVEMIQSNCISGGTPLLSEIIPLAVYLVLRGTLACAFHISVLTQRSRDEYIASTKEPGELPSHAYENKDDIPWELTDLADLLDKCHPRVEEKRHEEYYKNLKCLFQDQDQDLDNVKYLRALISRKADTQPLEIGTSKSRFYLKELRARQALLLISDLSLSNEEIVILDHIYKERQNRAEVKYEIVWLPVVDATTWDEAKRFRFEELKSKMPWYAVHDPQIIEPPVIKFIRNDWHFDKKMIIVSLDPQGRVSSLNVSTCCGYGAMWLSLSLMRKSRYCGMQRAGDSSSLPMALIQSYWTGSRKGNIYACMEVMIWNGFGSSRKKYSNQGTDQESEQSH
ncbi:Protein SIEVE ELEMENT OCCLUSION B [Prunus dulcis]|uniref:Protein SIEVE ELEMENT OCCLUSION B n=1 Tax=Prunus dulcis TaxID=3755 RepID=A0A4Y1RHQ5_PRUDU|nr:Protein SIEVE ELEMENT OCCLUSION B [Prunus dulcis]